MMSFRKSGLNFGQIILAIGIVLLSIGCGGAPEPESPLVLPLPTLAVAAKIGELPEQVESARFESALAPTFTPESSALIVPTSAGRVGTLAGRPRGRAASGFVARASRRREVATRPPNERARLLL